MSVKEITTKAQYDELLASGKVIFIDFYAEWCGPCKMISPTFNKLAEDKTREGVEFYKLNIDDVPDAAEAAGISALPAFHAYRSNQRLDRTVGAMPSTLKALVERHAA